MRDSLGEVDCYGRGNGPDADTIGSLRGCTPSRRSGQFADYYPLIAQAVDRLKQSTAATRQIIYDRARSAMTAQLRNVTPPLSESDINREQLALEKAIRKVETESLRVSRTPLEPLGSPIQHLDRSGRTTTSNRGVPGQRWIKIGLLTIWHSAGRSL
jgi:hypothetical protein